MTDRFRRATTPARVLAVRSDRAVELPDTVVTEEPMEIRVAVRGDEPETVSVTMRTPGHDFELAAGFLVAEGVASARDLASVRYCQLPEGEEQQYNTVTVTLRTRRTTGPRRTHVVSSACGVCGTASLDEVVARCPPVERGAPITRRVLVSLPEQLRSHQELFDRTGGLHAAALFSPSGDLLVLREDVGRHNAMDKLVGWAVLDRRLPLTGQIVMVSGRVGFEIVQKAAVAGIGVLAAVSAPSSLAVATAERLGVTLVGFLRGEQFNVYTHRAGIALDR